jgi:hypothetical protein
MSNRFFSTLVLSMFVALPLAFAAEPAANVRSDSAAVTPFQQQLIDTQKAFLEAFRRGDAAYVNNAVAGDFELIAPNGDMGDRSEVVAYVQAPKDNKEPEPILYDFKVVPLSDSAAIVSYNAVFPGSNHRYQHLSNTWVKEGSQWKLKFQQSTVNLWSADDL